MEQEEGTTVPNAGSGEALEQVPPIVDLQLITWCVSLILFTHMGVSEHAAWENSTAGVECFFLVESVQDDPLKRFCISWSLSSILLTTLFSQTGLHIKSCYGEWTKKKVSS